MSNEKVLIDADILCYRIGFAYENETNDRLVRWQVDRTINGICDTLGVTDHQCYLTSTDKSNFRYQVDSTYKSNRTAPRPKWFGVIREHLINDYQAEVVTGMEADDAIGIEATKRKAGTTIFIASIDKDLLQIPGHHFNFVSKTHSQISVYEGDTMLGKQLLTGDITDGVRSLGGIGRIKAERILEGTTTRNDILQRVQATFISHFEKPKNNLSKDKALWQKELRRVADLIFIRRFDEPRLILPFEKEKLELDLKSTDQDLKPDLQKP